MFSEETLRLALLIRRALKQLALKLVSRKAANWM